ncbi:hypothetical protein CPB83DRAFT_841731 [Crepidotus variabilis]|uniref:F-box domain-containing protein n=1 Tax=Crepidotus variabilis TaxID=179855 RepID=A0A9P6ESN9_9AGAR|nr:hypothetical protein CPB83DRAFT_841731 [Crepidotus variabilis]
MASASFCGLICMQPQSPDGDPCVACAERWNPPTIRRPSTSQIPKLVVLQQMELTSSESSPSPKEPHEIFEGMPIEIVGRIFEHSIRSDNPDWPLKLPFKLGSVCSQWRQIAWSTPSLWTDVLFSIEKINLSRRIDLLEEIIPRSGTLLLTLRLTGVGLFDGKSHPPESFKTSDDFQRFTRCLYDCSRRWHSLDLNLFDMSYIIPLFQLLPDAPNLKKLQVFLFTLDVDTVGEGSPAIDIDFAALAPNIQAFNVSYHPNLSKLSLCWDKLIELSLGDTISEIIAATQRSHILRRLFIVNRESEQPVTLPHRTLCTHTNLRSIHIEDAHQAIAFFSSVVVPNLEDLSLSTGDVNGISLAAALERSCRGRTLTRLKLYNVRMGDDVQSSKGILAVLSVLPSLIELDLSYQHSPGKAEDYCGVVFRTFGSDKRALLPNLQVFHLEASSSDHDDFQFLGNAFTHIQHFSSPLREFTVTLQVHRRQTWMEKMAVLVSLDTGLSRQIQAFQSKGRVIRVLMKHGLSQTHDIVPLSKVV